MVPRKPGNQCHWDPVEGRGEPEHGTVGGQDDGNTESPGHLHETATDSRAGETRAEAGAHHTRPSHRHRVSSRSVQRAVTMVLEAIYEQEFHDGSYGFRPARSAHHALQALWDGLMKMHGGWVLELDIERFFDTMVHEHLRSFLDRRVRDGVLRRTINQWLKAGVLEAGELRYEDAGTPQGGVISPLLANVYLHEVLDTWFETEVKPRLQGHAFLIRYADDAVLVFSSEADARRVMAALPERFGMYGLALHTEKTRLVKFARPRKDATPKDAEAGSFELLGFTHFWGKSRKDSWVVKRTRRCLR